MVKNFIPLAFIIILIFTSELAGNAVSVSARSSSVAPDTITEDQILYNGRIWRNQYLNLENDQFLFTNEYIPGTVTMRGKCFTGIVLRYDIYNDEIITPADIPGTIQINKELVDSFSLIFGYRTYRFSKIADDTLANLRGYVNVLYKGRSALYMRYVKELYHMSGQNVNDRFFQKSQLYFVKDKIVYPIKNKRELFGILKDLKPQIKDFIKKYNLEVSGKEPESFVPVLRFADSLTQ